MYYSGRTMFAPTSKDPSTANIQNKRFLPYTLFLLHMQAQKKKLSKRKRRHEISRSAECDKSYALLMSAPFKKGARKLYWRAKTSIKSARNFIGARYEKKGNHRGFPFFVFTYCRGLYVPRGDSLSYRKRRHFFRPPARQYQPFSYSAQHKGHAST